MVYTSLMRTYQLPNCFLVFDWCKVSGKDALFSFHEEIVQEWQLPNLSILSKRLSTLVVYEAHSSKYPPQSCLHSYTIGHLSDAIERLLFGLGIGHRGCSGELCTSIKFISRLR